METIYFICSRTLFNSIYLSSEVKPPSSLEKESLDCAEVSGDCAGVFPDTGLSNIEVSKAPESNPVSMRVLGMGADCALSSRSTVEQGGMVAVALGGCILELWLNVVCPSGKRVSWFGN